MSINSNAPVLLHNNMQLRNLFLNPTKGPERESVPTMKAVSVSNWGQAKVSFLYSYMVELHLCFQA